MKTQSAKAKGRRLQQEVRDDVIEAFALQPGDVRSTSMGASGEDLLLSPRAQEVFPFDVECKNQEALSIWKALEQVEKRTGVNTYVRPLLVFKRNHSSVYVALRFDDLLELLKGRG